MFLNDPKTNKPRKITRLSGPYSFFYITPKTPLPEFPNLMLLGDVHGYNLRKGESLNLCDEIHGCSENNDCIAKDKDGKEGKDCCFRLSNKNFFKLLHHQTNYENPIDIYTEHWSHEYDPQDELIRFDSELDRIEASLKRFIHQNKLYKKFKTRSRSNLLKRISKTIRYKDKVKCQACGKSITESQPYYANENDVDEKYHIKCVNNIRWQSADARRSFAKKSIENAMSNIIWDFDDESITRFSSLQHYLLMLPIFMDGKPLVGDYSKDIKYKFPDYSKNHHYQFQLEYMIEKLMSFIFDSDEYPSVIRKQFRKQIYEPFKNKRLWKRVYKRSVDHFLKLIHIPINPLFAKRYMETVSNRLNRNTFNYDVSFITNVLTTIVSPFLDIYTLMRMFKGGQDRHPLLTIIYAGGFHSKNIFELLTMVDPDYPEYSINYYQVDTSNVYSGTMNNRCVHLNHSSINLSNDISKLREQREMYKS
jgi:hypothetical protein